MTTYTPYIDFTAQAQNIEALNSLYGYLRSDKGSHPAIAPIVVFMAFTIESYLNSIGSRIFPIWDEIERLPWKKKVALLYDKIGETPDWGQSHLQFADQIFKLRDKLAHGKPERVKGQTCSSENAAGKQMFALVQGPEWYRGLTKEWAIEAYDQHLETMRYFGRLFGFGANDFFNIARGNMAIDEKFDA